MILDYLYRRVSRMRSLWRNWLHRRQVEEDLDAEVRAYVDLVTEENKERGMAANEAYQAAMRQLGGVMLVKEQTRDAKAGFLIDSSIQDIRSALRTLQKSPGFTAVSALSLALGIGAVTAVFSVVDTTLLRPLPYPHVNRIMAVARLSPRFDHPVPVSGADFLDWRIRSHAFSQMAAYVFHTFTWTGGSVPEQVAGSRASTSFFSVLGIQPQIGRLFRAEEDQPGKDHVVLLSHELWRSWFASNPQVVGQPVMLDGEAYTIIGVLPPSFSFEEAPGSQLWTPLVLKPGVDRGNHWLHAIAKLAPGVTVRQAQAEMDVIAAQLQREYPHEDASQNILVLPFQTRITGINRDVVLIFFCAVILVLLIACTNLAGLLLARASSRRKVFAMRAALGASRLRLIRELTVESLVLGLLGGTAGIAMAYILTPLLRAQKFIFLPRAEAIAVDGRILLFALGLSILTGILFGLAPALQLSRVDLNEVLKTRSGETAWENRWSLRRFLVVGEIAISLVLLIAAGLLTQSMVRALRTDPGYQTDHLLTFWLTLPPNRYSDNGRIAQVSQKVLDQVARMPGVQSVGLTTALPPSGWEDDGGFLVLRHPASDMQHAPDTYIDAVSPGFFATIGLPLLRGRLLTEQDNRADASKVVVISRTLANRYFGGEDPIGQQMKFEEDDGKNAWTVVGIVADTRFFGWDHDTGVFTYFPYQALGGRSHFAISIRTVGDPSKLNADAKKAVWSVDRDLPLLNIATMRERMDEAFAPRRFHALLFASFAGTALLLASLGIFGLISYAVAQRTREIGVRMALGARRQDVLRLILKQAFVLTLAGISLGLPCSLISALALRSLLYNTTPFDVPVFLLATAALLITSIVAAFIPGRWAASVDPMKALRVG